ncbi:MAG: toll/interleukin-1 receptor domain-containing protein [Paludibacteraceae bacterium]|nr:toll/interleukin-1 receptor domain-containing protein [Paludibacteraceae bacterium]
MVDSFAFDAGSELTQEIKHSISTSEIFVLFISDEALNSTWVNEEINYVRDFVDEKKIEFCPFIVMS